MIQIVIPAAGNGQRFKDAGYKEPKPLIPVLGKPMVEQVLHNIKPTDDFTAQVITKEDLKHESGGAVDTILQANIDPELPLLIANCDQLLAFHSDILMNPYCDGCIAVFKSNKKHHSYVETGEDGHITKIAEKLVISNQAVSGVYYFKVAKNFIDSAKEVIAENTRVKGEYYVSSVLAKMIEKGLKISTVEAPTAILGTPEELQLFEAAAQVVQWIG